MKPKKSLQIFKNFLTRLGRIYKNNRNYNTGIRCMQEQKCCHYLSLRVIFIRHQKTCEQNCTIDFIDFIQ